MRMEFDSVLANSRLGISILYLIAGNMFLLILFGIFLNGAAFPYGEIRGDEYWIVNNDGARAVSGWWFWTTFWHGSATTLCLVLFLLAEGLAQLVRAVRARKLSDIAVFTLWAIGGAVGVRFMVMAALSIAEPVL